MQTEHSCPKIRNASSLSSQCSIQRLAPRLVAGVHTVAQPALASLAASFGESSSVKVKRYANLPLLAPPAPVSRSAAAFNCPLHCILPPPHVCVRPHHPGIVEPFVNREVQLRAVSGLRLCMKDEVLQACVFLGTQGAHSRIRWSSSQECQHVISSDIRPYNKKLLGTSPALQQEVVLPANFMLRTINFYLRAAISDCLLIGFIRATETLKKDLKQAIRDCN